MLKKSRLGVLRPLLRLSRNHGTSLNHLVNKIQYDTVPIKSPVSDKLNELKGQMTLEEIIKLQDNEPRNKKNLMSCVSGVSQDVMMAVMKEIRMKIDSISVQAFLITELMKMIRTGDVKAFKIALSVFNASHVGLRAGKLITKIGHGDIHIMYQILIEICIYWNNTLLGATIALGPEMINEVCLELLLRSLLVKDPQHEEILLDLILKIGDRYDYKFNEDQIGQIFDKLEEVYDKTSILKRIVLFLIDHSTFTKRDGAISKRYAIIMNDSKIHNSAGVYLNWREVMGVYPTIMDHDLRIVAMVIRSMLKSKQYHIIAKEIVEQIPKEEYTHPFLINPLLEYSFSLHDVKLANTIVEMLEPPVHKDILSTLLKINLSLGDYSGMERVLQQINLNGGMTSRDYSTIAVGLIKKGDMNELIRFVQNVPIKAANGSILKLVDYFVNTRGKWEEKEHAIVDILLKKVVKVQPINKPNSRAFWNMIGSLYIKYLTKNYGYKGVWKSKEIYERSTKDLLLKAYNDTKNPLIENSITLNPFGVDFERSETVRLNIDARSKAIVVKTIMDSAKRLKMKKVVDWCLQELRELGTSQEELQVDITKKYSKPARKIGLRDWEDSQSFRELWEQGAVPFVKER